MDTSDLYARLNIPKLAYSLKNLGFLNVRYYEILYFAGEYELIRK